MSIISSVTSAYASTHYFQQKNWRNSCSKWPKGLIGYLQWPNVFAVFVNKWLSVLLISAWFPYFVRRKANSEKFLPLAEETYDVGRESVWPPRYRHLVNEVKFFANIGDLFWSFVFGNVNFKCARACTDLEKDKEILHAKKKKVASSSFTRSSRVGNMKKHKHSLLFRSKTFGWH